MMEVLILSSLYLSIKHGCIPLVTEFWEYVQKIVEKLHKDNNRPSPPVARIPNTYDPSSGSAYYFTEHGDQICKMLQYRVSGRITTANYDEPPIVDGVCNKKFPRAHTAGFGYLFCGFVQYMSMHMDFISYKVEKSARTPLAHCTSTWKHHQKMFSMTACQLSEYCLNREPELFKNTRFRHNLFHAIGHKCGICFKSGRVCGLEGINTEICEQVNAFLQCIKYTAAHLSQEHFTFCLQFFFLYLLNKEKTKTFIKQAAIAVAGQM